MGEEKNRSRGGGMTNGCGKKKIITVVNRGKFPLGSAKEGKEGFKPRRKMAGKRSMRGGHAEGQETEGGVTTTKINRQKRREVRERECLE